MIFTRTLATLGLFLCLLAPAKAQILIPQQSQLFPPDPEVEDHFGLVVSADAGTIVVGVRDDDDVCPTDPNCNSGSVHVFTLSGTVWSHQQKITAFDAAAGDDFGACVALSGDTVVIGAPGVDAAGNNAGAVYVFTRTGTVWTQQGSRLIPPEVNAEDCFGDAVGLEGDLLVAGARFHENGFLFDAGSAYVFNRSGSLWTQQAELLPSDPAMFNHFGGAVDASTDRVVIGCEHDDAPGLEAGSAYVFRRIGLLWVQETKLIASNATGSDMFGTAVAYDQDRIVIGAPFADRSTVTPGLAYVFERSGLAWNETAILRSVDLAATDRFGASVDVRNDIIVVGTPMDNHLDVSMGSTYVFELSGLNWIQEAKLVPFGGQLFDEFGNSVSTDGTTIAVGSWLDTDTAGAHQGTAYAFGIKQGVFKDFCFGDGGDQMGCTDCPCMNNSKPGSTGGCANSVGYSARLSGFGIPSAANDTLRFEAVRCRPGTFGLLFSALNELPSVGPCAPGSGIAQPALLDGLRCAGVGLERHGTRATDMVGSIGITTPGWGGFSPPPIGLIAQGGYVVGQTRHFQIIYRESPLFACGTGLSTTNGVSVQILP